MEKAQFTLLLLRLLKLLLIINSHTFFRVKNAFTFIASVFPQDYAVEVGQEAILIFASQMVKMGSSD